MPRGGSGGQLDSQVPYKKVDDEFLASPEKVGHQFTTHICIYMNFMNPLAFAR